MATYSIKAPNGQTYQIDGPDGASQEEVQAEVMRQHPEAVGSVSKPAQDSTPASPSPESQHGALESTLRGLGQGALFGFGDEAEGAYKSLAPSFLGGNNQSYDQNVAAARKANAEAAAQHPLLYNGADVAGAVGSSLIPGVGLAGRAAEGAGLAANLGRAALAGAAAGGLRGAGEGDGLAGRLQGAAQGAAVGGATGGALGAAGGALNAGGRMVNNLYSGFQNAEGNIVNHLTGKLGAVARAVPGVGHAIQNGANGVADGLDNNADALFAKVAAKSPKLAQWMANAYNSKIVGGGPGLVGRAAGAVVTHGHNLATEAAVRTPALLAQGTGALLRNPNAVNAASNVGTGALLHKNTSMADVLHNPEIAVSLSKGTKFEKMINDAASQSPQRLKAVLFTLQANPEFRQTIGVSN